jgi:DNA processing protein
MLSPLHYQIALTLLPGLGTARLRPLLSLLTPSEIFQSTFHSLQQTKLLSPKQIETILAFNNWSRVQEEINFIQKNKINTFFIDEPSYPHRLRECTDAPLLLYGKGNHSLNTNKVLAVVGTRTNSDYGQQFTTTLLEELKSHSITIVSGLAYGIDTLAHRNALAQGLPTIAVLAQGLDKIYPWANKKLAREIIENNGALLTECRQGEVTDTYLFPRRNRIVAGIAAATLVIESDLKGGSLITADLAFGYSRTVFAVPGRSIDRKSRGCLQLIKNQKAQLITGAHDILYWMNWLEEKTSFAQPANQRTTQLLSLADDDKFIVELLQTKGTLHLNDLLHLSGWPHSKLSGILLNLSLAGLIVSLPGNQYRTG